MDRDQRRSALIAGGVVTSVLVLLVVGITLSGGDGDKTTSVDIERSSSTSSSSTTTPTVASTTTLVQPVLPPVAPLTSPPQIVIVPPTPAAPPPVASTAPRTAPPTPPTKPPTTSTTRPREIVALETQLESVLNGGTAPDPGSPARVRVVAPPAAPFQVTWSLDPTLSTTEQKTAVRAEAFALLEAIQSAHLPGHEPLVLRATLPDPATGNPKRVVRLRFERATLDAIDFGTTDPQRIFMLADQRQVDPSLKVAAPPTTTTSTP